MKLDFKFAVAFGLGLLLIVVVGISSLLGIQRTAESNRMVAHTQEVLASLEHILSLMKDAETGQRGFILTGEERYLEPFNAAVGEVEKATAALAALTSDNPTQQLSIRQLAQLSREKFEELRQTIALRRKGSPSEVLTVVRSDRGRRVMDEIRKVIGQMEAREWQLLGKRSRMAGDTALQNSLMVGAGMLLSLAALAAAALVMIRTLRGAEESQGPAGKRGSRRDNALRYLSALAMVALAMLARQWLAGSFGPMPPFITLYPAVLLVASVAGGGPGILTTLIAVLAADYWYFQPVGQFGISSPNEAISLGIFGAASMFLSVLAERLHRARLAEAVSITQKQELALLDMGNLLVLDQDRRVLRWSQGCCRLYGFAAAEAEGRPVDDLLQTRVEQSWEEIQRSLLADGYWEGEIIRRDKSGSELQLTILLALRRDRQGRPQATLEVSTDLTTQKSAERELLAHKVSLQAGNDRLQQSNLQLQAQAEELQAQREELQVQAEELQSQNLELSQLWGESRKNKEALARSQERLMLILDSAGTGTFEWDVVSDKRNWDDNVHRLSGTDPLSFTGSSAEFRRVVHPDDWGAVQAALLAVLDSDLDYRSDYRVIWPDGTVRFITAKGRMHRDAAGQPARLMGVCWDVTEQKHAEDELQKSEERFRTLVDAIPQLCWAADAEGWIFWYNERWYQYTGTTPAEMEGWGWQSVHDPEVLPQVMERWQASIATGKPFEMVFPLRGNDGVFRPFLTRVMPLCDPDGKVVRWFGTNTDIAERERAAFALSQSEERYRLLNDELELRIALRTEELQQSRNQLEEQAEELTQSLNSLEEEVAERQMSEEKLRLLIDGARDYAIIMLEADGCVSSWNEGATRLKGWSEGEILGRHFSLFYPEASVAAGKPQRELELAASEGRLAEEGWRLRKDGSRFLADVIITAIRDDSGKLRGFSKITRDITERKRAEEQMHLTLAELERSNKELEQFAYVASHDLQEPLRMVASFTQLLAQRYEGQLDDQAKKFIGYAVDGAVRMQRLINDLLVYSRVSTQAKTLEEIDSHAALGEAVRNLAGSIEESRAMVVNDDLPIVRADATQLSALFQNLIGNAIKFRGAAVPLIHVSASDLGSEWRFSVRDNGIGIENQFAEKVFVIFQRLHTRQEYPGTGIGLAICKRIVERHGGRIWFESVPGAGSTFNFTISK